MGEIAIGLPDGSGRKVSAGTTAGAVLGDMPGLVAAKVDGAPVDLERQLTADAAVQPVLADTDEGRTIIRHSASHVLAQAVTDLYPEAKYAIGPAIEDGFYYDFEVASPFTPEDLERIEARMREIVAEGQPFRRRELGREEALELFAGQPYKREIIESLEADEGASSSVASVYENGPFTDLCRGPHVPSTARVGAFRLLRSAGAYWRGDEHNTMLQRIYGTAWESAEVLETWLKQREEAERRDHRKLGRDLDLFSFPEELGAGLAVWHPKGAMVRKVIEDFSMARHLDHGYKLAVTPHLARSGLWETSGHLEWYADGMYPPMKLEGATYYPKPMNCPFHMLIYRSQTRSYRELPLRLFEFGTVYRFERSGVLHGLLRARGFTQDDSHIFCSPDQLEGELASLLEFVLEMLRAFGFEDFEASLSTRPHGKSIGTDEQWAAATEALRQAIEAAGIPYKVDEGGGAFYAPKIDLHVADAIGRRWQLSTLQVDFLLPERFDLSYMGEDNSPHRPFMIHRALFGSLERFFGILLEHYAGAFPTWLAPVQAVLIPIATRHTEYAAKVVAQLEAAGLRAEVDDSADRMQNKIRRAQLEKVPYMLIVGDADASAEAVSVRLRDGSERRGVPLAEFIVEIGADVAERHPSPGPAPG